MSVETTRDGDVATVTISNPKRRNAMDAPAAAAMADAVRELAHDDSVRCVVVTGEVEAGTEGLALTGDDDTPDRVVVG